MDYSIDPGLFDSITLRGNEFHSGQFGVIDPENDDSVTVRAWHKSEDMKNHDSREKRANEILNNHLQMEKLALELLGD